jgi:hypothetical protein
MGRTSKTSRVVLLTLLSLCWGEKSWKLLASHDNNVITSMIEKVARKALQILVFQKCTKCFRS